MQAQNVQTILGSPAAQALLWENLVAYSRLCRQVLTLAESAGEEQEANYKDPTEGWRRDFVYFSYNTCGQ